MLHMYKFNAIHVVECLQTKAKVQRQAKIPFDYCYFFSCFCRLFFLSFRFRLRFCFGVIRPGSRIYLYESNNIVKIMLPVLGNKESCQEIYLFCTFTRLKFL